MSRGVHGRQQESTSNRGGAVEEILDISGGDADILECLFRMLVALYCIGARRV